MSPDIQLTAIRDHCAARGYELVAVLEDIDRTGRLWKRRQIEQAVAMVEAGTAEVVVVWKVSRVSRNRVDWAVAVDRVEGAGGRLESATEPVDTTTSTGRFTRGMLAELAAFESERMGETWKEVHRQRVEAGLPHYGPARLGYTYDRATGYTIDPDTAPAVTEMYRRYTTGQGVDRIAQWLTALGVKVPKSGADRWSLYGVRYYLDSGFAAGLIRHKGTLIPGAHQAILTGEEWAAYLRARATRTRERRVRVPAKLRGLVLCGKCGSRMQQQGAAPKVYYTCRANKSRPGSCAAPGWALRRNLEDAVFEWLGTVADEIDQAAAALPTAAVDATIRERLERQMIRTDEALTRLTVDLARGLVPEQAYVAARAELEAERAAVAAELAATPSAAELSAHREAARGLLARWDHGDPGELNAVLAELCTVVVTRGKGWRVCPAWG